jgi:hypothetical protein
MIIAVGQKGEPMSDTISRQAAIANAISGRTREIDGEKWIRVSEVRESIKTLPSAEPKTGKWLEKEVIYADEAKETIEEWQSCKCSKCGRYDTRPYLYYFSEPRFCSWCGALNGEGSEE